MTLEEVGLNLIYSDPLIEVGAKVEEARVYIHCRLYEKKKVSAFKHYLDVMDAIELEFKDRGIEDIYTHVSSRQQARWVEFLGFEFNNEAFKSEGKLYEIMKKRVA